MSYSVREVSAMLGLSAALIRSYASKGVLQPERGPRGELLFGFADLILLRTAGELSAAKIPQRKVQRVLERLREQLPEGKSLTGVRIAADGERVVVSDGGAVWNPESGQSLFDFSAAEIEERTHSLVPRNASAEPDAEDWYERACELESSSTGEAIHAYRRAIELDPRHADAHINLGRMLHENGSPKAAEEHYRAAAESDPEYDLAWFNLGVALEDLGRLNDASEAYRRALDIDPYNADAHYNLSGILERRGDKPGALRHLNEYRKLRAL
jgi:tetratricopeptide (TPR) repeat protein